MGGEWKITRLSSVAELTVGYVGPMVDEYVENGVPFLRSKNIDQFRLDFDDLKYIKQEFHKKLHKSALVPGDVVIVRTGKPGTTCVIPESLPISNCSDLVIVRPGQSLDSRFFSYFMNSIGAGHVHSNLVGAVQQHFNVKAAARMEIPLPPLPEQRAIAHILGSLDDKIALNRKMNATLEAMAQALFQSWFVDFDPVIDKALAAGHEIPEPFAAKARRRAALGDRRKPLPAEVAALFPDRFVETEEMGWVPEGWGVKKFDNHAIIEMGQSPPGESYNSEGTGVPLINGPVEFGEFFTARTKWTTAPTKVCAEDDLIVCVRGSTTGRFVKSNGTYCLGRGVCSIRGRTSQAFVDYIFKYHTIGMLALTTGSTFPNWSKETLSRFLVIAPDPKAVNKFQKITGHMIEKQKANAVQLASLTTLRDTLLPKLISGELRLRDAEATLQSVLP